METADTGKVTPNVTRHSSLPMDLPDECLQMTVEWYKMLYEVKPHEAMYEFCTRQIVEYVERAKKRNQIWVDKIGTRT
jgi:hypothetical protein